MNLYVWRSEKLRGYLPGYIIVLARKKEEAINLARREFEDWLVKRYDYLFETKPGAIGYADDMETIKEYREEIEADLAREPTVYSSTTHERPVILIEGSA